MSGTILCRSCLDVATALLEVTIPGVPPETVGACPLHYDSIKAEVIKRGGKAVRRTSWSYAQAEP